MKNLLKSLLLSFILLAIWGCADLDIQNPNEPDKEQALSSPSDFENLIGGSFHTFWHAFEHWEGANGLTVIADEQTSSWGNAAMKDLSSEPRMAFVNSTAYIDIGHVEVPWYGMYSAISSVNDALSAILDEDNPVAIGVNGADTPRALAFGRFMQGMSYCFLGAYFDQAYIIDENSDMEAIVSGNIDFGLSPYQDVIDAGITFLNLSIDICNSSEGFTLPDSWINGLPISNDQLARVANSYIARYMAAGARSPLERANADWGLILSHIANGIMDGEDFGPYGDSWSNWNSWYREITHLGDWTRADYKTIGLTDTSGNYSEWLSLPVEERNEFEIHTSDRRITGSDGSQSAGTYFAYDGPSFFRPDRGTYHFSYYNYINWEEYFNTGVSQLVTLKSVEMDLLKAEGLYRQGDLAGAAEIVNQTRVGNGQLDGLTGSESDFFKWLKYEKKIETFTTTGLAYFDRRGWEGDEETGQATDLVAGTPIHFPIPARELEISNIDSYTFGGGGEGSAPKQTNIRPHNITPR